MAHGDSNDINEETRLIKTKKVEEETAITADEVLPLNEFLNPEPNKQQSRSRWKLRNNKLFIGVSAFSRCLKKEAYQVIRGHEYNATGKVDTGTIILHSSDPNKRMETEVKTSSSASKLWATLREKLPELHLTESQRNSNKDSDLGHFVEDQMVLKLWMCVVTIFIYLAIGTVSYSCVFEKWTIIDSLYFSMVTFTTVGYGDAYPTTEGGHIFTALYSLVGISFLGVVLGVIGSRVVEYETRTISQADRILKEKNIISLFSLPSMDEEKGKETNKRSQRSLRQANVNAVLKWIHTYIFVFITLVIGSLFIGYMEGWGWKKAVYFCTMTATTVGYGDFVPSSPLMRLFAVIYIPILVGVMFHLLGSVATLIFDMKSRHLMLQMNTRQLQIRDLQDMHSDGDGDVSEMDFVSFMLCKMQKIDKDLLAELRKQFKHFDMDSDGFVSKSDLYQHFLSRLKQTDKKLQLAQYKDTLKIKSLHGGFDRKVLLGSSNNHVNNEISNDII